MNEDILSLRTAVDSLLLPLSDQRLRLLVPLTAVAEVLEEVPIVLPSSSIHPWVRGWLRWRERDVPLLAYEGIAGRDIAPVRAGCRVVIFNAIGAAAALGFYGILIHHLPKPLRLGPESDLRTQELAPPRGAAMLVEVGGEPATIPDFEQLELLALEAGATPS